MTLQQIIKDVFEIKEKDEVLTLLKVNDYEEGLKKSIKLLNKIIKRDKDFNDKTSVGQVYHVATIMLVQVNEKLRKIPKEQIQRKEKLESVLGAICKRILQKLISNYTDEKKSKIIVQLLMVLSDICEFYNYNRKDLFKFIGLDELSHFKSTLEKKGDKLHLPSAKQKKMPHYIWEKENHKLDSFICYLVDDVKICEDRSKLTALFSPVNENLNIEFNHTNPDRTLKFLCCLKDSGLVRSKGDGKQGFYTVLKVHIKQFDKIFLRYSEPNKAIDRIKKQADFKIIKEKFEKGLKKFY